MALGPEGFHRHRSVCSDIIYFKLMKFMLARICESGIH